VGSPQVARRVIFRTQARADVANALDWYQRRGVGAEFLRAFEAALDRIRENPFLYQVVEQGIRRAPLRHFPYGLMYFVGEDEVVVLTCFHDRRDPGIGAT
jgi:plasmid stabilization system protein ParE